jgi:integrase
MRLQAVRPAQITKLYRDLLTEGGRSGAGLSARTVEYVHAVLRKAFRDAVLVDQLLPSNPVERAKRPRNPVRERGEIWSAGQPFFIWLLIPVPAGVSYSTCAGVM